MPSGDPESNASAISCERDETRKMRVRDNENQRKIEQKKHMKRWERSVRGHVRSRKDTYSSPSCNVGNDGVELERKLCASEIMSIGRCVGAEGKSIGR